MPRGTWVDVVSSLAVVLQATRLAAAGTTRQGWS